MTQEEKQLLLKDLCARLPYGVKCYFEKDGGKAPIHVVTIGLLADVANRDDVICKPYLRKMPDIQDPLLNELDDLITNKTFYEITAISQDWYNKHHFDYHGLIPMGLALEAPEGMYTVLCRNNNAKTDTREKTPFFDKNGVRIYDGDVFVYLKYTNFEDGVPSDLIENYSKYENEVVLHPVFWYDKEKSWCSDVYGDCDYMASYDFNEIVVVTNKGEHPELYNY